MSRWSIIEHPRLKPSALVSYSCTEIPDEKPKRWRSPKPLRRRTRRGPRRRGQPLCRAEPGATFSKLVQNLFAMIEARWLLFLHRNTGRKPRRWRSSRPLRRRTRRGPRRRGQPLRKAEPGATFSKSVQICFTIIEARWLPMPTPRADLARVEAWPWDRRGRYTRRVCTPDSERH